MRQFLTKHGMMLLSAATAIMVLLSLVTYFSTNTNIISNLLNTLATPFRTASSSLSAWVEDRRRYVARYDALEEENEQLKLRIAEMEEALRQAEADSAENALLRDLLKLREQRRDLHWEKARIIERDASNWASTLTLNAGTEYGVEIGDCVITEAGYLVGSITGAGSNWSTCTTLIDTESAFGAKVFRTGTAAVAQGDFSLMGRNRLKLDYLSDQSGLMAGDLIVTSGLGGFYPPELVIGTVSEVQAGDDGLAQYAVLTPAAELEGLEQVYIIKDFDIVE